MVASRDTGNESRGNQVDYRASSSGSTKYSSKKCSYCGKMGHIVDDCYKKHGFPHGFKFKNLKYANRSVNMVQTAD